MVKLVITIIFFMLSSFAAALQPVKPNLDKQVQHILDAHYKQYKDLEYFSGFALSYYLPGQPIKNYYSGYGSITKSFTAAIMLDLEKKQLFIFA